jgi:tRNA threonylcarbamoyl adenosine modification protein YjeE
MPDAFLTLPLADEAATAALAEDVAAILMPGDVVALAGELGAGKTTFARAVIRAIADDPALEVPSPTFTLVQTYATGRLPIAHFDLYRIGSANELEELGLDDALAGGAVLIEWPERAAGRLPAGHLEIALEVAGGGRVARFIGDADWAARIARTQAARALTERSGWPGAARRMIAGDASTRRYERIASGGRSAILMDWPKPSAPPVRDSRAAYRAQDVRAVIVIAEALRAAGLSVPRTYATDIGTGLVLTEDFGGETIAVASAPEPERYRAAMQMLAFIHARPRAADLPDVEGAAHRLLALSPKVLAADLALFTGWYMPHATGEPIAEAAAGSFAAIWDRLFARTAASEQSWVLFDVQSSNLFWLPERQGLERIGLIDFQDMFTGPSAYDVASLGQDARVTVPKELEASLRDEYVARRREFDSRFDAAAFDAAYAILGAARLLKIFGVFARLAGLGKTQYLQHLPRLHDYLGRNFAHPVLSELAVWYERHLPPPSQAAG